jgi:hypothetical protein
VVEIVEQDSGCIVPSGRSEEEPRVETAGLNEEFDHDTVRTFGSRLTFILLGWPNRPTLPRTDADQPFDIASLHFTLGFIIPLFSHRCYDLSTVFAICTLHDEIQARFVQEMLYGVFQPSTSHRELVDVDAVSAQEYWSSLSDDEKKERGTRRTLVGLFEEGSCNSEFTSLRQKLTSEIAILGSCVKESFAIPSLYQVSVSPLLCVHSSSNAVYRPWFLRLSATSHISVQVECIGHQWLAIRQERGVMGSGKNQ